MDAMPRQARQEAAQGPYGIPLSPPALTKPPQERTPLEAAEAKIFLAFGNPNGRIVRMAATMLRSGPDHPAARARYGTIAGYLDDRRLVDLDGALGFVERMLANERFAHARSAAVWQRTGSQRPRLLRDTLHELVLIGRWLRLRQRRGLVVDLPAILESLATPAWRPGFRVTHAVRGVPLRAAE